MSRMIVNVPEVNRVHQIELLHVSLECTSQVDSTGVIHQDIDAYYINIYKLIQQKDLKAWKRSAEVGKDNFLRVKYLIRKINK